jgi:hypothetical protein
MSGFSFSGACFGAFGGQRRSCGFCLSASGFFGAHRFDASSFLTGLFGRDGFELGGVRGCRFCCGCRSGGLLFGCGLDVGSLASPSNGFAGGSRGHGFGRWLRGRCRATAARGGRGSRLLFGASTLLTFPARADASDLVVGEHTHVAANGNVHLPKKRDDFFGGHCEFVRQLTD